MAQVGPAYFSQSSVNWYGGERTICDDNKRGGGMHDIVFSWSNPFSPFFKTRC